jgi:hypothetical protein
MPGQIATLVLACQCGKRTIRGLRPDPDYVPAERDTLTLTLEPHEHEWRAVPYDALGQQQLRCAFPDCTALMTRPRVAA